MIRLNSPLGLRVKVKVPSIKLEGIPILNVLCIAFFLTLLSSKYLFAPGLTIELPESSQKRMEGRLSTAILSVNEANIIFFEGNIYNVENLEIALTAFTTSIKSASPILLAKVSKGTEINTIFKICEIAHKAGFSNIQLAANSSHHLE